MSVDVLRPDAVLLDATAADADDAVARCGQVLTRIGAVEAPYVTAMLARERAVSTVVGRGVALPHGVGPARQHVLRTAVAVVRFPAGVDWRGDRVTVCAALACREDEPVELISLVTRLVLDEQQVAALHAATDPVQVVDLLRTGLARLADPAPLPPVPAAARRSASAWAWLAHPPVPVPGGQVPYSPVSTAEASLALDR
ncbi:PTS sugar transporter subunit IIA [Lentzea sp. NPDC059081]|uniref:PTS sugar transporter subunit IIA n=1 Tax=Lentzea sp. NPDC059081 TaxID=3346719 RepID=UPI0036C00131